MGCLEDYVGPYFSWNGAGEVVGYGVSEVEEVLIFEFGGEGGACLDD